MLASTCATTVVGNLYNRDAAHKNCGEKTGAIAHNSAAKGYQQRLAISFGINQTFRQLLHGVQPLGRFAIMHFQDFIGQAGIAQ